MRDPLTPKQVARAIDVSESSVKRWSDKGVIQTQYRAGGHRRIAMAGILELFSADMQHLEGFAQTLRGGISEKSAK